MTIPSRDSVPVWAWFLPEKIASRIEIDAATDCWLWTGMADVHHYGKVRIANRHISAHRAVYQHIVGDIPKGLVLDHLCRVRRCVNPAHLEPVTHQVNILRGEGLAAINAAKTTCPLGHSYTSLNTYWESRKGRVSIRVCRTCRLAKRTNGRGVGWRRHVTHCPQGHEYTPANTYLWKGRRQCAICRDTRNKGYRAHA